MTMISKYGMGTLYQRGENWWVQYFRNGERIRESAKTTEEKVARQFLKRRLGEAATGAHAGMGPERTRISDLLALLLEDYKRQEQHSTATVAGVVKNYLEPLLGKVKCSEFGSSDVSRYIRKRQAADPKPANATINRELAAIRRALQLGFEHQPPLMTRQVKVKALDESGNARKGFIDREQYDALKLCLPEYLRPIVAAGFYLGCRLGELQQIKWDQVDFTRKEIVLYGEQTKNKQGRELPLYGELLELLKMERDAARAYPKCPWVFHRGGLPVGDFRKAWATACKLAGMSIVFHDLRRSAARNMEMAGIRRTLAMRITGHKTESMYRRYAGVFSSEDLSKAGTTMEQHFNVPGKESKNVTH